MIAEDAPIIPASVPALNNRQKQKKPKTKERVAIKPEHFQSRKGLRALYEKTKELQLNEHSEINVQNTMKKIVVVLKSWHFQMVPKYSFDLFLQRCQALGSDKRLSAYMSKVRKIHRGMDEWQSAQQEEQVEQRQQQPINVPQNQLKQSLQMLNLPPRPNLFDDGDDQDDDLLDLMIKMEQKVKEKKENPIEEFEQPYVPEGFEPPFSDDIE